MHLQLLVTPLTRGAYFADRIDVARAELGAHFPDVEVEVRTVGALELLAVELPEAALPQLARLSFVQAIFEASEQGLRPLEQGPAFDLPEDLVWGAKYRGKTHELVTQLAINLALRFQRADGVPKLLDPMAGRGTTLLWAARYGIDSKGIELDRKAIDDLQRHVKKQTKLHRIKHQQEQGFVGKRNRNDVGRFLQYTMGKHALRLTIGDSAQARELLQNERFSLLVTDLPYGIQHLGKGGTRNPLENIAACAAGWAQSLRAGGAMVLIFNALQPKRPELVRLFTEHGLIEQPFAAPHRMSESIVRDLVVLCRP